MEDKEHRKMQKKNSSHTTVPEASSESTRAWFTPPKNNN